MPIHVIRHGFSEANDRNNIGTLAFADKDAPLKKEGRSQARERAATLGCEYGINPATTPVAVSYLLRTKQTAEVMGFRPITPYESLNEVEHGMELLALRALLDIGELPRAALQAAAALLRKHPSEKVWVAHGLIIAGLCHVLGISHQFDRLIPRFCEVRALPI